LFDFLGETESFSETSSRHSRSNFCQVLRELGTDADDAEIQSLFDVTDRTQAISKASNGEEVKGNMEHKTKEKKKDQSPRAQAKKRRQRRLAAIEGPLEQRKTIDFNWKLPPFSRNRRSGSKAYARRYLNRSRVFNRDGNAGPLGSLGLTRRETEVLTWITQGKTNYEIGVLLNISTRTICKHVQRVLNKLNVENRTAAAAIAIGTSADAPRGVLDMLRGSMGSPSIPGRVTANANHPRPHITDHGSPIPDHSTRAGFTLLELLVVVGIIATALVSLLPAVTSLSKSGGRRAARDSLLGGIEQARAEAITSGQATYVVFPTFTSGTQSTLDRYSYRSYAIFEDNAASPGNVKQLTDWKSFPAGVALRAAGSAALSNLADPATLIPPVSFSFTPDTSATPFRCLKFNSNGEVQTPAANVLRAVFEGYVNNGSEVATTKDGSGNPSAVEYVMVSQFTGRAEPTPAP
jgi:prepilin-type N-terminal cleavage/methylation domain-containing protein